MKNRFKNLFGKAGGLGRKFAVDQAENKDEATVYVYDAIGGWFGGVDAQEFVKALAGITAGTIHLRINSPGGDVFDARAMQTALRQHKAKVVAHIDGLAASAATFLAMGSDEIEMAEGGFFMIHNAWSLTMGNAADHVEAAAMLEKVDASIRGDYARKTGKEDGELQAMMDAETWMTAQEAMDHGFVDSIYTGQATENSFDLSAYDKAPAMPAAADPIDGQPRRVQDLRTLERRLSLMTEEPA